MPLADDHRLYVVYRAFVEDEGFDYLLHHPDWDAAEHLAQDEGHFMGHGLSWPELTAAADNGLPGGSTTDAYARLLLLLPALGDDAVPDEPSIAWQRRCAPARGPRPSTDLPRRFWRTRGRGSAPWTMAGGDYRINDGRYSFRNPADHFAWSASRLARVSDAMAR